MSAAYRRLCCNWKDKTIRCPFCGAAMSFAHYRKEHALRFHDLDEKTSCLFCSDFRWARGAKSSNFVSSHLHACLKVFVSKIQKEARDERLFASLDPPSEPPELCPCADFDSSLHRRSLDGRSLDEGHRSIGFYDDVLWNESFWRGRRDVAFDPESGLGSEVAVMVRLHESGDWKFHHCIVWPDVFVDMLNKLGSLGDSVQAAPFWCLCDGHKRGGEHRVHRHLILLTNAASEFIWLWSRIPAVRDHKRRYEVKNLKYLSNLVRYVSQQRSTCDGVRTNVFATGGRNHHFHINRPVYPHALVAMFSLWRGGMKIYAHQKLQRRNVVDWPYEVCENRKHRVLLKETGIVPRNCVVPLRPDFKPAPAGRYKLHLSDGRELRYSLDAAVSDRVERLRSYASSGNLFMNAEDDAYYVFGKTQAAQVTCIETTKARMRLENNQRLNTMQASYETRLRQAETRLQKEGSENGMLREKVIRLELRVLKLERSVDA